MHATILDGEKVLWSSMAPDAEEVGRALWEAVRKHDVDGYELELGTPWDQPEAYARVSYPFRKPGQITAPTLFLCAEQDLNVPCEGSQQMYQALRTRGVPTRLVIYPGTAHTLTAPSHVRDRMQRSLDWYAVHLKRK